jgi:hypothetical protein
VDSEIDATSFDLEFGPASCFRRLWLAKGERHAGMLALIDLTARKPR